MVQQALGDLAGQAVARVEQVAPLLGIGRSALHEACTRGEVPSFKLGRRRLIPVPGLAALLLGVTPKGQTSETAQ
jgi:excisionase family DNA binding protein